MPIRTEMDRNAGILRIDVEGTTSKQEWIDALETISSDPDFNPEVNLLIDVRRHESVAPSEIMWKIGQIVEPSESARRWALVVSRVVSEGLTLMLATIVEDSGVEVKAFRDPEEAENWLSEKK